MTAGSVSAWYGSYRRSLPKTKSNVSSGRRLGSSSKPRSRIDPPPKPRRRIDPPPRTPPPLGLRRRLLAPIALARGRRRAVWRRVFHRGFSLRLLSPASHLGPPPRRLARIAPAPPTAVPRSRSCTPPPRRAWRRGGRTGRRPRRAQHALPRHQSGCSSMSFASISAAFHSFAPTPRPSANSRTRTTPWRAKATSRRVSPVPELAHAARASSSAARSDARGAASGPGRRRAPPASSPARASRAPREPPRRTSRRRQPSPRARAPRARGDPRSARRSRAYPANPRRPRPPRGRRTSRPRPPPRRRPSRERGGREDECGDERGEGD